MSYHDTPDEAQEKIHNSFEEWTSMIHQISRQAIYAIIAAIWAVYGSHKNILDNSWAKWAMVVCVLYLILNIVAVFLMGEAYGNIYTNSEKNNAKWKDDFEKHKNIEVIDDLKERKRIKFWPYTEKIEFAGTIIRYFRVGIVIIAGFCLIVSLFFKVKPMGENIEKTTTVFITTDKNKK